MITATYENKTVHVVKVEHVFRDNTDYVSFNFIPKKFRSIGPDCISVLSDFTNFKITNTKD